MRKRSYQNSLSQLKRLVTQNISIDKQVSFVGWHRIIKQINRLRNEYLIDAQRSLENENIVEINGTIIEKKRKVMLLNNHFKEVLSENFVKKGLISHYYTKERKRFSIQELINLNVMKLYAQTKKHDNGEEGFGKFGTCIKTNIMIE